MTREDMDNEARYQFIREHDNCERCERFRFAIPIAVLSSNQIVRLIREIHAL